MVFLTHEISQQDPMTVYVVHQFALLPGPGRLLPKSIVRSDEVLDRGASHAARRRSFTLTLRPLNLDPWSLVCHR